jgi:hypothetical protein
MLAVRLFDRDFDVRPWLADKLRSRDWLIPIPLYLFLGILAMNSAQPFP